MGADIHVYVEAKDQSGTWHCAWHDTLRWSGWFESRFGPKNPKDRYTHDPLGIQRVRSRDYLLFGFLSDVRSENYLAKYDIGSYEGYATQGWPSTISPVLKPEENDVDYHSHGYLTLTEVLALKKELKAAKSVKESDKDAWEQKENVIIWADSVIAFVGKLLGDDPLIGHAIGRAPDDDTYDDPDFDICIDASGHRTMENYDRFRKSPVTNPDDIRILICYDN